MANPNRGGPIRPGRDKYRFTMPMVRRAAIRAAHYLRDVDRLSIQQIEKVLGVSETSVYALLHSPIHPPHLIPRVYQGPGGSWGMSIVRRVLDERRSD